jgi:Fe-S-cluster-containing dehydrogenase component
VVACYAENNIGVTEEDQAAMQRVRQWILVDRYWETHGDFPDVSARFLPVMCQQCAKAPCEPVCPVFASLHSRDGLNEQVYNRCIGTRYCAQNCPYKARVFNFFAPEFPAPLEQQLNPDVTVRTVGIMEKCTFCVQRIRRAVQRAGTESRDITDSEITPACVQTCPPGALVFGNLNDPTSRVAGLWSSPRGFKLLEAVGSEPSVVYLQKIGTTDA